MRHGSARADTGQPLVILDRDGVINEDSDAYIKSPEEWIPIPGAAEAIARLNRAGYQVVVATNQSGVGRGYYSQAVLDAIHAKMLDTIRQAGGQLAGIYFCPHTPDDHCDCRKPATALVNEIREDFHFQPESTFFVGDSLRDLQCARDSGCIPVLVKTGKGQRTLDKGWDDSEGFGNLKIHESLADFANTLV